MKPRFRNRSRPCLQYQIKRCSAPCVGLISVADYQHEVDQVVMLLQGKNREINGLFEKMMEKAPTHLILNLPPYFETELVLCVKCRRVSMSRAQARMQTLRAC